MIDTDLEKKHMVDYLQSTWDNSERIGDIIEICFKAGLVKSEHLFKPKIEFLDKLQAWEHHRTDEKNWTLLPKEHRKYVKEFDAVANFIQSVLLNTYKVERQVMENWNYSNSVDLLTKEIKQLFPEATKMRPIGWTKLAKNYTDYAGMEDLGPTGFKGAKINEGGNLDFDIRTSLPHVMYDDKCQGRRPLEVLVGAVFAQGILVRTHNNNIAVEKEIERLQNIYIQPEHYQKIAPSFKLVTDNTILKMINAHNRHKNITESQLERNIDESIRRDGRYNNLSDEEKQQRHTEALTMIQDMFKQLGSKNANKKRLKK